MATKKVKKPTQQKRTVKKTAPSLEKKHAKLLKDTKELLAEYEQTPAGKAEAEQEKTYPWPEAPQVKFVDKQLAIVQTMDKISKELFFLKESFRIFIEAQSSNSPLPSYAELPITLRPKFLDEMNDEERFEYFAAKHGRKQARYQAQNTAVAVPTDNGQEVSVSIIDKIKNFLSSFKKSNQPGDKNV